MPVLAINTVASIYACTNLELEPRWILATLMTQPAKLNVNPGPQFLLKSHPAHPPYSARANAAGRLQGWQKERQQPRLLDNDLKTGFWQDRLVLMEAMTKITLEL